MKTLKFLCVIAGLFCFFPTLTVFFRKRMIISCVNFSSDTTFTHHRLA